VYVDTSVVGGCFDDKFAAHSRAIFDMVRRGEMILLVSYLLLDELRRARAEVYEVLSAAPEEYVEMIEYSVDAVRLRDRYLSEGILGPASSDDALHVALATVAGADLIVSWNFKHIVHYDKIRKFNGVNLVQGYSMIEIRSPLEVV